MKDALRCVSGTCLRPTVDDVIQQQQENVAHFVSSRLPAAEFLTTIVKFLKFT